jgi:hypothetical protein
VPLKGWYTSARLHGATSQKTVIFCYAMHLTEAVSHATASVYRVAFCDLYHLFIKLSVVLVDFSSCGWMRRVVIGASVVGFNFSRNENVKRRD